MVQLDLFNTGSNKSVKLIIIGLFILIPYVFDPPVSFRCDNTSSTVPSFIFKKVRQITYYNSLNKTRIHIITISDANTHIRYRYHSETLLCYANRHGYQFSLVDPNQYYTCSYIVNFHFQKQCAALNYLIQNIDIQWLVVLDGDTFVVNATRTIESFIPNDSNIHLIHYERFWNNEISAGNYIIKNHPWSVLYLNKWVESFKKLPNVSFHNNDNGALHLHFLDMVGKLDKHSYETCFALYNKSFDEGDYMKYVRCTKCVLKGQRIFPHIILHRRGHSFCRDSRLPIDKVNQLDFMLHGYKKDPNDFFEERINPVTCINNHHWTPTIRKSLIVSDLITAKSRMAEWEEVASKRYSDTVTFPEIANCWPDCESEITGANLIKYRSALCN